MTSAEHFLIWGFFMYLVFGIPMLMILMRAGFSGWWSVLTVVPIINLIALWVFAMIQWPKNDTLSRPA